MNFREIGELVYFIGIEEIFSGLVRLYSRKRVNSAGNHFKSMMLTEMILGISIVLLNALS
jgi:hypothetical protein